uniref:Uncharacterized protein n=1 Tax=Rhizophora mucronata TaxID=61149 RepID=A0A2P2PK50_RHIMU
MVEMAIVLLFACCSVHGHTVGLVIYLYQKRQKSHYIISGCQFDWVYILSGLHCSDTNWVLFWFCPIFWVHMSVYDHRYISPLYLPSDGP